MGETASVQSRIIELRNNILALIDEFTSSSASLDLPPPKPALKACRYKIEQAHYKVLVVGEMKRGKSSFINALIGHDVLPTDVDVATCQVFLISNSSNEAYRLRFEDGSSKPIERDDLARFGSQGVIDRQGVPALSEVVRWIEIDVPIRFLPTGISILDTPGLGSLYAPHSEITQRFVPQADAVIYTLDTQRPLGDEDARTIEKILQVTPDIFFVQTKIDQVRKENWEEIRARNEALLREKFGERLKDPRVWPISSINLMKAAATGQEGYLKVSRFRALAANLQVFLFRAVGLTRAAEAGVIMNAYYADCEATLRNRQATLAEDNKAFRQKFQIRLSENRAAFERKWGANGAATTRMLSEIRSKANIARASFLQAIKENGRIERQARAEIASAATVQELACTLRNLNSEVNAETMQEWNETCGAVMQECTELVGPLTHDAHGIELDVLSAPMLSVERQSWFDRSYERVKGGFRESMVVGGVASLATAVLGIAAAPYVALGAVATAIWAIFKSNKVQKETELNAARREAYDHLSEIMFGIREYFRDVDRPNCRKSRVDEFFDGVVEEFQAQVRSGVEGKVSEVRAEEAKLLEAANSEGAERDRRLAEINKQCELWRNLGQRLRALDAEYESIDGCLRGYVNTQGVEGE